MANEPVQPQPDAEYLTNHDLSVRYQVPLETIRKWRWNGYGPPALRLGRHVRYRRSDVLRWEEERSRTEVAN